MLADLRFREVPSRLRCGVGDGLKRDGDRREPHAAWPAETVNSHRLKTGPIAEALRRGSRSILSISGHLLSSQRPVRRRLSHLVDPFCNPCFAFQLAQESGCNML